MDTNELQKKIAESHKRHFSTTSLEDRIKDIEREAAELVHYRDKENLIEEAGDLIWSLIQLTNELGLDFSKLALTTSDKLDMRTRGKKIALLGTSANPITNAHLTMALEILALTDVAEVWFYLVGEHPWGKKLMPMEHRLEMARLATEKYKQLKVCDFEIIKGKEIYKSTFETAEILRDFFLKDYQGFEFSWIMGSDVAIDFHKWKGSDWMAEHLRIFIVHRLGYDFDKENSILKNPKHIYLKENIVTSNISSTLVRERGKSYEHSKLLALVPDIVWDYLEKFRLLDPEVLK
jgi:nicotinate (nicotinamide) nucleotide adenylyltransferase